MSQYCVAALEKEHAILGGLRLVLEHLGTSELAVITLKEHYPLMTAASGRSLCS